MDYPAVVVPAGHVSTELDREAAQGEYTPRNELDAWNWALRDAPGMEGMPVDVQIVGRRLEEEVVLGAAGIVDQVLKK